MASQEIEAEKPVDVLKLALGDDVRRIHVDFSSMRYSDLVRHVAEVFRLKLAGREAGVCATFRNEEGERVRIADDFELAEAFKAVVPGSKRHKSLKVELVEVTSFSTEACSGETKENRDNKERRNPTFREKKNEPTLAHTKANPAFESSRRSFNSRHQERCLAEQSIAERVELRRAAARKTKPVPLKVLSGSGKIFFNGTVQGNVASSDTPKKAPSTSEVPSNVINFPSFGAQGLALVKGKWHFECTLLSDRCIQIGWATTKFVGNSANGEGVGDCAHSWSFNGHRQIKWHGAQEKPWGPRWKIGQTVCCAIDLDKGKMRFALDGRWDTTFEKDLAFEDLLESGVREHGIFPAVTISEDAKCRINFGAPGTPLLYRPPDNTYKSIWKSFSTRGANILLDLRTDRISYFNTAKPKVVRAATKTGLRTVAKASVRGSKRSGRSTSIEVASSSSKTALSTKNPLEECKTLSEAQQKLVSLLSTPHVRDAISKALSAPAVADAIQSLICYIVILTQFPPLIAVRTPILEILQNMGLLSSESELYKSLHSGEVPSSSAKRGHASGGAPGRASRDTDWRAHSRQGIKENSTGVPQMDTSNRFDTFKNVSSGVTGGTSDSSTPKASKEQDLQKAVNASLESAANQITKDSELMANTIKYPSENQMEKNNTDEKSGNDEKVEDKNCVVSNGASLSDKISSETSAPTTCLPSQRPKARFIKDNSTCKLEFHPGQAFTHSWRIRNNGIQAWGKVSLKFTGGAELTGCDVVRHVFGKNGKSGVDPDETVDVKVNLVAPSEEGRYISYFRLHDQDTDPEKPFGNRLWVDLSVISNSEISQETDKQDNRVQHATSSANVLEEVGSAEIHENYETASSYILESDSESDCEFTCKVIPDDPDWIEIENSIVEMSEATESPTLDSSTPPKSWEVANNCDNEVRGGGEQKVEKTKEVAFVTTDGDDQNAGCCDVANSSNVHLGKTDSSSMDENACASQSSSCASLSSETELNPSDVMPETEPSCTNAVIDPMPELVLKLASMGFHDIEAVRAALTASNGDISEAVEIMLSHV